MTSRDHSITIYSKHVIPQQSSNTFSHFLRHVWRDKDAKKLGILLMINIVCMFMELIYGFLSNSIGLISDAAHMLFDSTALAVGIYASYKAKLPPNHKFSYGYERFQTLAGFINGIFLIFIAFYIFIEALERIYDPPVIYSEKMIVVAIIGLIVNLVGVIFFHEHAHFHGINDEHSCKHHHHHPKQHKDHKGSHLPLHSHHGHSHGQCDSHIEKSSPSKGWPTADESLEQAETEWTANSDHHSNEECHEHHEHNHGRHSHHGHHSHHKHSQHDHHGHHHDHSHQHDHHEHHDHHDCHHDHSVQKTHKKEESSDDHLSSNENLYADLLGSVGVIISSLLIMMFDWYITDALCSAATSILILLSIVPLMKSSILIFLQTYPSRHEKVFQQALSEISYHPDVIECKDPHLWAYTHDKLVCSLILVLKQNVSNLGKVLEFARERLESIHGLEYITIDYQFEDYE